MASYNEVLKGQGGRYDAHPDSVKTEKTVESTMQDLNMNISAPKTEALDSNKSGGTNHMSGAVSFLKSQVRD